MIAKRLKPSVLSLFPLALFACASFAADFYVSPDGDDSAAGTSVSTPWGSIAKANDEARPGDVVYLRGGRYIDDPIRPARSGKAGSPIRYTAYRGEKPVLSSDEVRGLEVAINLSKRSHVIVEGVHVDGVEPNPRARVNHFLEINDGSFNTLRNNTFRFAHGWHGIELSGGAHHNRLLNNTADVVGIYDDGNGQDWGDVIQVEDAEHNLIQGNTFTRGAHNVLQVKGRYNVLRLNTFENDWSDILGGNKGGRNLSLMGRHNLFERNIVRRASYSTDKGANSGQKVEGRDNIVRRNFIYENSKDGITSQSRSGQKYAHNNHIFHNTIYSNAGPAWTLIYYDGGDGVQGNVFKNNIVYANRQDNEHGAGDIYFKLSSNPDGPVGNSTVEGNLMARSGSGDGAVEIKGNGVLSLDEAEREYSGNFKANIQATPQFASSSPHEPEDFALEPGSPGIDQGVPLTRTRDAGRGTTLAVADAGYFSDGFSVASGDRIRIADAPAIEVVEVDYGSNTLELAGAARWEADAPVSLDYRGAAPDIGAQEAGLGSGAMKRPKPPGAPRPRAR